MTIAARRLPGLPGGGNGPGAEWLAWAPEARDIRQPNQITGQRAPAPVRILNEGEIRGVVTAADAVRVVEQAFAALAKGEARLPDPLHLDIPDAEGEVHLKGAHLAGAPYFVFKVASGFWRNPEKGLPTGSGLMLAFDGTTGFPAALLLDNGFLTEVRTGAAGAVAAKYLARRAPETVAVIGAGRQARHQLRALAVVRELRRARIWSRTRPRAESCAREMSAELGVEAEPASTVEAAVREADVVITVTPSREPLVRADWLAEGTHITAVGSDGPDKQELHVEVLARADRVVADRLSQCLRLGEIHHAVAAGVLREEDVAGELGDLVIGRIPGRTSPEQITVADLTGVGVQDAAIAAWALERAAALDLGRSLEGGARPGP